MICKKSASTEHWGRQVAWPWNSDKGQLKWRQTTQRWVKTATATKNTWLLLLLQYIVHVTTGFEIQTMREIRTTPPPPQESLTFSFFLSFLADLSSCNSLLNRQSTHAMHIGKQERRYWIFVSGYLFHRHVLRCVLTWPQSTTFSQNVSAKNGAESRSFAQCKGFLESGVQGNFVCGIRKTVQGVRNPSNDWNPESKFHYQRLEYSTWNLRRGIQNTRTS